MNPFQWAFDLRKFPKIAFWFYWLNDIIEFRFRSLLVKWHRPLQHSNIVMKLTSNIGTKIPIIINYSSFFWSIMMLLSILRNVFTFMVLNCWCFCNLGNTILKVHLIQYSSEKATWSFDKDKKPTRTFNYFILSHGSGLNGYKSWIQALRSTFYKRK